MVFFGRCSYSRALKLEATGDIEGSRVDGRVYPRIKFGNSKYTRFILG